MPSIIYAYDYLRAGSEEDKKELMKGGDQVVPSITLSMEDEETPVTRQPKAMGYMKQELVENPPATNQSTLQQRTAIAEEIYSWIIVLRYLVFLAFIVGTNVVIYHLDKVIFAVYLYAESMVFWAVVVLGLVHQEAVKRYNSPPVPLSTVFSEKIVKKNQPIFI